MSEKLTFEQSLDHRRTVQHHVPSAGDGTERMQRACNKILARPGGPSDQCGAVVWCNPANLGKQFPHLRTAADHPLEAVATHCLRIARKIPHPLTRLFRQTADALAECCDGYRFIQIIRRTLANGFDRGFGGVVRGHQHNVDRRIDLQDFFQQLNSRQAWHHQVGDDNLGTDFVDNVQCEQRVVGSAYGNPRQFQSVRKQFQAGFIVVDNQNRDQLHVFGKWASHQNWFLRCCRVRASGNTNFSANGEIPRIVLLERRGPFRTGRNGERELRPLARPACHPDTTAV
jgi:hypothetical protein